MPKGIYDRSKAKPRKKTPPGYMRTVSGKVVPVDGSPVHKERKKTGPKPKVKENEQKPTNTLPAVAQDTRQVIGVLPSDKVEASKAHLFVSLLLQMTPNDLTEVRTALADADQYVSALRQAEKIIEARVSPNPAVAKAAAEAQAKIDEVAATVVKAAEVPEKPPEKQPRRQYVRRNPAPTTTPPPAKPTEAPMKVTTGPVIASSDGEKSDDKTDSNPDAWGATIRHQRYTVAEYLLDGAAPFAKIEEDCKTVPRGSLAAVLKCGWFYRLPSSAWALTEAGRKWATK